MDRLTIIALVMAFSILAFNIYQLRRALRKRNLAQKALRAVEIRSQKLIKHLEGGK